MDLDGDLDPVEQILELLVEPVGDTGSRTEELATLAALLRQLEADLGSDPEAYAQHFSRMRVSPDLPRLIGEVVIAAAWAEDAAGTLLQASSGKWDVRATGYDDSSSRLVKALRSVAPAGLVDRLETALELRHFVVHGVWVNGSFITHPETGQPYDFVSMKRRYRTEAPEKDMKAFMKTALEWLANEFWAIEAELERLHSEVLSERRAAE